jgi:hypothetical protein
MAGMTPSFTWSLTKSGVACIFSASCSVVISFSLSVTRYYVASPTVRAVNREGYLHMWAFGRDILEWRHGGAEELKWTCSAASEHFPCVFAFHSWVYVWQ